jgi:histidinol-phosphate aminotransferase
MSGAAAAISDSAYYDEINRRVIATRERTAKELCSLGFTILPSTANFLFIKPSNISGAELFAALRGRGILVRHFNKDRISDFLRVSIGTDQEMDAFLNACKDILSGSK